MNKKDRRYAIWHMNGYYYDTIMNTMPAWLAFTNDADFDQAFDDWFYSQIGL